MQAKTLINEECSETNVSRKQRRKKVSTVAACRWLSPTSHIQVQLLRPIALVRFQLSHDWLSHDFKGAIM